MKHPWLVERPVSPWVPGGLSRQNLPSRMERPVLDQDKCNKCLLCWIYCADGTVNRGEQMSIDYKYCKGCGVCAVECPRGAITMVREGAE